MSQPEGSEDQEGLEVLWSLFNYRNFNPHRRFLRTLNSVVKFELSLKNLLSLRNI